MSNREYKGHFSILNTAPGPAPWYFGPHTPDINVGRERWAWSSESKLGGFWYGVTLRDRASRIRLLCPTYSYVKQIDRDRIVAWQRLRDKLQVAVLSLNELSPIPESDLDAYLDKKGIIWRGEGESESVLLNGVLGEGNHALDSWFERLPYDELLILGNTHHTERMAIGGHGIAIFVLQPHLGQIRVIPQDWFNNDDHIDFYYQWITRVARDDQTRRLVIDGIRIGARVLDESGRGIGA